MTWLSLIETLVAAVAAFVSWLRDRRLLDAGAADAVAAALTRSLDEIGKANAARDSVRGDFEREPGRLRDDDGFERRD